MFLILGSGFGLYGYLPALVGGCGQIAVLPARYRPRFSARSELQRFSSSVRWAPDEIAALGQSSAAALALRPEDQETWLVRCLARPEVRHLLLEKPLARTPALAQRGLDALVESGKDFRIGYLFGLTGWGRELRNILGAGSYGGRLFIRWQFCAHHYRHDLRNWKRYVATGGGAIRFFGVQVIALLARLGYRDVAVSRTFGASTDEVEMWSATMTGPGLPECSLMIDTRSSKTAFQVMCQREVRCHPDVSHRFTSPFASGPRPEANFPVDLDPRIRELTELCRSLLGATESDIGWYQLTLDLWRSAEDMSTFDLLEPGAPRPSIPSSI